MKSAQDSHEMADWKLINVKPNEDQIRALFTMNSALPRTTVEAEAVYAAIVNLASPAPSSGTLEAVKALEWHKHNRDDIERYSADPPFAQYIITWEASGYVLFMGFWGSAAEPRHPAFAKLEAAKAAAQADYEQRILSALTHPLPQSGADSELVEPVAWTSADQLGFVQKYQRGVMSRFKTDWLEPVALYSAAALSQLHTRLATVEAENKRWQDNWDANVQEMSEKFRAVNIAKVIEATGADIFALRDRAEVADAKLAEALTKLERADEGLANAYSATYNDYDRDRLACERIGLQKGIAILRSSITEKTTPKESN